MLVEMAVYLERRLRRVAGQLRDHGHREAAPERLGDPRVPEHVLVESWHAELSRDLAESDPDGAGGPWPSAETCRASMSFASCGRQPVSRVNSSIARRSPVVSARIRRQRSGVTVSSRFSGGGFSTYETGFGLCTPLRSAQVKCRLDLREIGSPRRCAPCVLVGPRQEVAGEFVADEIGELLATDPTSVIGGWRSVPSLSVKVPVQDLGARGRRRWQRRRERAGFEPMKGEQ